MSAFLNLAAASLGRALLSGGEAMTDNCSDKHVSYEHRVDDPENWNWCLVPNGGIDAVFFAGLAVAVMCLASPRWDALIVLFFGGIYEFFAYYYNLEHVSNAVALWLGMRPADIFVYVFLPPFLLDLSVRIDFFMLKKVAFNIGFMAFIMVIASALLLIPFMLYALDLKSHGWTAGYVALFGAMIASTDAASVSAVLRSGGGPEILSVLLEGESLFNDASSLTLYEIFHEVVTSTEKTTLAHDLQKIVRMTVWSAFTGVCIGVAFGIITRWIYAWLQHRNMESQAEVAWSIAGCYLSFYITQVWCKGSGCIGAVAFGLYGSATLLWGMSTKARLTGIFMQFWQVITFIINGLIFFYVGASAVNFTIRSSDYIYSASGGVDLVKMLLYKLPLIYLASFSLRFILTFLSFKFLQFARLSEGMSIQEVVFVTVGGLRGSLSLVLAQSAATMASSNTTEVNVKAEIAIYTAGYVLMTLLINAPLCGLLLTLLGLDKVRQEQLRLRGEVKSNFRKFTENLIGDLVAAQDDDELLQGIDWRALSEQTNFDKHLDKELPEVQPSVRWCACFSTCITGPIRLARYVWGTTMSSSHISEASSLDRNTASQKKEESDLKRTTQFNMRELTRNESRAVPSTGIGGRAQTHGSLGPPSTGSGTNPVIIRDKAAAAAFGSAGSLTRARASASGGKPAPLLRSNSRRKSAVAPANGDLVISPKASAGIADGAPGVPAAVIKKLEAAGSLPVGLPMPPPAATAPSGPAAAPEPSLQEEDSLLHPAMVKLSESFRNGTAGTAPDGPAAPAAAALAPSHHDNGDPSAPARPRPVITVPTEPSQGPGSPRGRSTSVSRFSPLSRGHLSPQVFEASGNGSPKTHMLHSVSAGTLLNGSAGAVVTPAQQQPQQQQQQPQQQQEEGERLPSVFEDASVQSHTVGSSAPGKQTGGLEGFGSAPEDQPQQPPAIRVRTAQSDKNLLQSMLVIRPGGGAATRHLSTLSTTSNVRLVQRLGDERGGGGLEAVRVEPKAGAGGPGAARPLGRGSVRAGPLAVESSPAGGRFQDPGLTSPQGDRHLGHMSASVGHGQRGQAFEPPSLSPTEFALPEEEDGASTIASPLAPIQQRLRDMDADGGGGLGRPSVRQAGGLARSSVKHGARGLGAASMHLARIYDQDGGVPSAGGAPLGRPSLTISRDSEAARTSQPGGGLGGMGSGPPLTSLASTAPLSGPLSSGLYSSGGGGVSHQQQQQAEKLNATHQSVARGSTAPGAGKREGSGHGGGDGAAVGGLSRRTRFGMTETTASALAKASASGNLCSHSSDLADVEGAMFAGPAAPLLVEYRLRLLAGLKQYYRQKHAEGSLSNASYKVLSYAADQGAHHPEKPLSMWDLAKKEVSSGPFLQREAAVYYKLKHWVENARTSSKWLVRAVVPRLLVPFIWLLSSHLSATVLSGMETAVELWVSLTQTLQTEWLQYSGPYGELLLEEVQDQADGAWSYIVERRIEAPNKFAAVQTHRQVIELLAQQKQFVRELNEGGMVDETECRKIVEMVERRLQLLARRGPRWRQPTVTEVLSGTAFLRGAPPKIVDWIRHNSTIKVYPQGAAIWDIGRRTQNADPDGLIVVIRGVVRMIAEQEGGGQISYYLGAGGVGGLVACVLEARVPGVCSSAAYAEGNAMGKGPVVMHIPWALLQVLRRFSREEGLPAYQALDLQLYRTAAVYVLDLLRQQVTGQFGAFIRAGLRTILLAQRVDGPAVRRQRIRQLVAAGFGDPHVDGGIDWVGELLAQEPEAIEDLLINGPNAAPATSSHHGHAHPHPHAPLTPHATSGPSGARSFARQLSMGAALKAGAVPPAGVPPGAMSSWVEAMFKTIAATTGHVLDVIRSAIKESTLVVLSPGQAVVQRSTMVLIQGSLEQEHLEGMDQVQPGSLARPSLGRNSLERSSLGRGSLGRGSLGRGSLEKRSLGQSSLEKRSLEKRSLERRSLGRGSFGASPGRASNESDGPAGPFVASSNAAHIAPSIMVWISDYFEGEMVSQDPVRVVAGKTGATLLVLGLDPTEILSPDPPMVLGGNVDGEGVKSLGRPSLTRTTAEGSGSADVEAAVEAASGGTLSSQGDGEAADKGERQSGRVAEEVGKLQRKSEDGESVLRRASLNGRAEGMGVQNGTGLPVVKE